MSKPRTPRSNDRRQIARIYRTSYPRADPCQILTCLSLSVIQSPIILPGGRILLRRLSGTERHAAFLYRFFPRNSKLDSHWTSNPFTALFPASSSNLDHKVYVYVLYIQAWTDITEPRHLRIHVYTVMYTGLGRIGSFTTSHHRRQHQGFPWTRGSREMRGSRVGRGRKFGARTAA